MMQDQNQTLIFERAVENDTECSATSLMTEYKIEEGNDVQLVGGDQIEEKRTSLITRFRAMGWKQIGKIILGVVVIAGICTFLGFLVGSNDIQTTLLDLLEWIEELPIYLSGGLIAIVYALALLVFCPGTPFNLACGFIFGLWGGFTVAITGCIVGATLAFVLGRTIAREWISNKVNSNKKLAPVFHALQKNGLYLVFLTRLSPLFPFPLLNYAFGIAPVSIHQYVIGTFLGSAPSTFAYCYLGTLMRDLTDMWSSESTSSSTIWLISIGGSVSLLSILVISIITHRAIKKATKEYEMLEQVIELDIVNIQLVCEKAADEKSETSSAS